MRQRTAVMLVDGSNIYATAKALGFQMDYRNVINLWESAEVVKAFYFTALLNGQESFVKPLVDWLDYNGWTCVTKPASEWFDPITQTRKVKGNMDIEIATIAFEMAMTGITDIVLFSGDGDFRFLVEALQRRYGLCVTVVSTIETKPPMCSDVLRRQADVFVDLNDWREELSRKRER
jgi:uncharacterized LabA/DUF88 family protein